MAAAELSTWEIPDSLGGARRPSLDDLGGAQLIDDDEPGAEPPKDGTELYADLCNQGQFQGYAAAQTVSSCRLTLGFTSGSFFIDKFEACANRAGAAQVNGVTPAYVQPSDFTITTVGAGICEIEWVTTKLPVIQVEPVGGINAQTTGAPGVSIQIVTATAPTKTKIRARLFDGNTLTSNRFTVHL